ncbi:hypothetical protein PVAP13_1NG127038 [Panicum virgatum]|uniref:Uncharacterized protein n=1 Tax=Panicum virgatum TaxID=38727 RepID=A0A8T0WNX6_PANVG|nr:hypothetical protein PVAP13_1NG127038 [Panicum virgatum]
MEPSDDGPAARVAEEEEAVAAVERGDPELPVAAEHSGEIEGGVDGGVEGWDCGPVGIKESP